MSSTASAQIVVPCIDSNRINPFFPCGPSFDPVCACDGQTYTNECVSSNQFGINTIVSNGVCQNNLFHFDFWPNPVSSRMQFYLAIAEMQDLDATMQIFNAHGNLVYFKLLNNLSSDFIYQESIELSGFQRGFYFIVVNANGLYKIRKFVKV